MQRTTSPLSHNIAHATPRGKASANQCHAQTKARTPPAQHTHGAAAHTRAARTHASCGGPASGCPTLASKSLLDTNSRPAPACNRTRHRVTPSPRTTPSYNACRTNHVLVGTPDGLLHLNFESSNMSPSRRRGARAGAGAAAVIAALAASVGVARAAGGSGSGPSRCVPSHHSRAPARARRVGRPRPPTSRARPRARAPPQV